MDHCRRGRSRGNAIVLSRSPRITAGSSYVGGYTQHSRHAGAPLFCSAVVQADWHDAEPLMHLFRSCRTIRRHLYAPQGCSTLSSWTGEFEMQHADANHRRVAA